MSNNCTHTAVPNRPQPPPMVKRRTSHNCSRVPLTNWTHAPIFRQYYGANVQQLYAHGGAEPAAAAANGQAPHIPQLFARAVDVLDARTHFQAILRCQCPTTVRTRRC